MKNGERFVTSAINNANVQIYIYMEKNEMAGKNHLTTYDKKVYKHVVMKLVI